MLKRGREEESGDHSPSAGKRQQTERKRRLTDLPAACVSFIFSFLTVAENIFLLRKVSRSFNALAKLPSSWPPVLSTSDFVHAPFPQTGKSSALRSRSRILAHLPTGYKPTTVVVTGGSRGPFVNAQFPNIQGERIQDLVLNNCFYPTTCTTKDYLGFLQSIRSLRTFVTIGNCLLEATIGFLASKQCTWELDTLSIEQAYPDNQTHISLPYLELMCKAPAVKTLTGLIFKRTPVAPDISRLLAQHVNRLTCLELDIPFCERSFFSTLFKGLPKLDRLRVAIEFDNSPRRDMVEQALLLVDVKDIPSLTDVQLELNEAGMISWRSLAILCSGGKLTKFKVRECKGCAVAMETDANREAARLARDAELVARCKPGLEILELEGEIALLVLGIADVLRKLGATVTHFEMLSIMDYDQGLFLLLARHWQKLTVLIMYTDIYDHDILELSMLEHLRDLRVNDGFPANGDTLTERCFPYLKLWPKIQNIMLPISHLAQTSAYKQLKCDLTDKGASIFSAEY